MIAFWARMLLPASSRGGETTAIPNLPGETAIMPPPTPLLAGKAGVVEPLARIVIQTRDRHHRQDSRYIFGLHDLFLVIGFLPPLARVAAIIARSLAFTLTEHCSV